MSNRTPAPARALSSSVVAASLALALAQVPASAGEAVPAKAAAATTTSKPASVAKTPPPANEVDPLDALRERLAERLGAVKAPDARNPNMLRVTARLDAASPAETRPAVKKAPGAPVAAASGAAATAAPGQHAARHWSYFGDSGPLTWAAIKPEFALCGNGKRQSPIDIRGGIAVDLDPLHFDYRASAFSVVDNGHAIQANLAAGNSVLVMGRRYELLQFHFHRPSEERIDGRQFEMDVHLVHRDPEGRLAVVAVLLERGAAQSVLQSVLNNLPLERGEEQAASGVIDLNHLLPPDRGYYTYMGSLTTPPCSEGVLWMVMRQPVTLSQSQLEIFSRMYPMNARPVQSASGRLIKQSQ